MDWIYRELSGIVLPKEEHVTEDDVKAINTLPNPPLVQVTLQNIYVRSCRLAGDAIDAGFGRFRTEDLEQLLNQVQGAPALIGHRKDTLGVARFFGGEIARDSETGISYMVPKFYWMRDHSAAEDLRINIDGGIINEASLGFTFRRPTCSICGDDIRRCDHLPGREYENQLCFFYYDEVLRVTEGSFVYRGAQPGTSFSLSNQPERVFGVESMPRFRYKAVWYRGIPEKLYIEEI